MNDLKLLVRASLFSVFLFSIHLADDIVRGYEPGTASNLPAIPIFVFWLVGTLVLAERRSGQIIMLLGALFAMLPTLAHMRGAGVGGELAKTDGAFLFIWTVFAIGASGLFSLIVAIRVLRRPLGAP
jgi:hypothetical protein